MELNKKFGVVPLLFGSLGLGERLGTCLHAQDIDILIPESVLNEKWQAIVEMMRANGYRLYDLHEHAFQKCGCAVAFAAIESLAPFAGVDLAEIPIITECGADYFLPDLPDWLKVYTASCKDSYRKNIKHKEDRQKIDLIKAALQNETVQTKNRRPK